MKYRTNEQGGVELGLETYWEVAVVDIGHEAAWEQMGPVGHVRNQQGFDDLLAVLPEPPPDLSAQMPDAVWLTGPDAPLAIDLVNAFVGSEGVASELPPQVYEAGLGMLATFTSEIAPTITEIGQGYPPNA